MIPPVVRDNYIEERYELDDLQIVLIDELTLEQGRDTFVITPISIYHHDEVDDVKAIVLHH